MDLGSLVFLLLVLACPLAMVWMMRGGHGAHGHAGHGPSHAHGESPESRLVDDLRRRRAELDDEIARLERADADAETPSAA